MPLSSFLVFWSGLVPGLPMFLVARNGSCRPARSRRASACFCSVQPSPCLPANIPAVSGLRQLLIGLATAGVCPSFGRLFGVAVGELGRDERIWETKGSPRDQTGNAVGPIMGCQPDVPGSLQDWMKGVMSNWYAWLNMLVGLIVIVNHYSACRRSRQASDETSGTASRDGTHGGVDGRRGDVHFGDCR